MVVIITQRLPAQDAMGIRGGEDDPLVQGSGQRLVVVHAQVMRLPGELRPQPVPYCYHPRPYQVHGATILVFIRLAREVAGK